MAGKTQNRIERLSYGELEFGARQLDNSSGSPREFRSFHNAQEDLRLAFDPTPSIAKARSLFFEGVKKFHTAVLEDLAATVLSQYKKSALMYSSPIVETNAEKERADKSKESKPKVPAIAANPDIKWRFLDKVRWSEIEIGTPFEPTEERLRRLGFGVAEFFEAIMEWSKRANLDHPWTRLIAYETLVRWSLFQSPDEELDWSLDILADSGYPMRNLKYPTPPEDKYELQSDYPYYRHREEERSHQMKEFADWLERWLKHREDNSRKMGFSKGSTKPANRDHFEWLAFYQCNTETPITFKMVGEKFNVSRKTAEDGIKKAAAICRLRLRPAAPLGRPKKK